MTMRAAFGTAFSTATEDRRGTIVLGVGCVVAVCAAVWFAVRVKQGMLLFDTNDEMEQYVAALMLNRGHRLYRDVFEHHGPITYMIAQLYTVLISDSDFSYSRLSLAIMAIISCVAVVFSPVLSSTMGRVWAGAIYLLLLASTWIVEGSHTLNYWTVSGLLFVIVIAQLSVIAFTVKLPSRIGLAAAGAAATFTCFTAYSNGPAAVSLSLAPLLLIYFSPDRKMLGGYLKPFTVGVLAALLVMGLWFWQFSDIRGFYIYHFYFNQEVFSPYLDFTPLSPLQNFIFSLEPLRIVHSLTLCLLAASLYIFVLLQSDKSTRHPLPVLITVTALLLAGVVLTNPRAKLYLVDSSFVLTTSALFSIAVAVILETKLSSLSSRALLHSATLFVVVAFLGHKATAHAVTWTGVPQKDTAAYISTLKEDQGPVYQFVRSITRKEGDLLVLSYDASIYVKANRLPPTGHLYYLPWQAAYSKQPKPGYNIDLCSDISSKRPAVIRFYNMFDQFKYSIDEYEPCVITLLKERYTALRFDSPWYIRNDLIESSASLAPRGADVQMERSLFVWELMRRSTILSAYAPIKLTMSPAHERRQAALKRIGVMFSTHERRNSGEARLHLKGPGTQIVIPFDLSTLADNEYRFFDLNSNRYISGEITSSTGGVSTWEGFSHPTRLTCLIYEYDDGSRRYTPSCPLDP